MLGGNSQSGWIEKVEPKGVKYEQWKCIFEKHDHDIDNEAEGGRKEWSESWNVH